MNLQHRAWCSGSGRHDGLPGRSYSTCCFDLWVLGLHVLSPPEEMPILSGAGPSLHRLQSHCTLSPAQSALGAQAFELDTDRVSHWSKGLLRLL